MLYPVGMPLSDHERKMLAEMEAAFEQDDPRLVSTLTGKARTRKGSRMLLGLLLILGGMVLLFGGLIAKIIAIGLLGFVIALVGLFLVVTNFSLPTLAHASSTNFFGLQVEQNCLFAIRLKRMLLSDAIKQNASSRIWIFRSSIFSGSEFMRCWRH